MFGSKIVQTRVKTEKVIPKKMTNREKAKAMVNDRKKRLDNRLKRNGNIFDTNDTTLKTTTKKARLEATSVVGKETTGSHFESGDDGNTASLVDDESVNDTLKQMKQFGKNKCHAHHDNHIKHMTISHEKKYEVSLLGLLLCRWKTVFSMS